MHQQINSGNQPTKIDAKYLTWTLWIQGNSVFFKNVKIQKNNDKQDKVYNGPWETIHSRGN